jgi:hypothetical protein
MRRTHIFILELNAVAKYKILSTMINMILEEIMECIISKILIFEMQDEIIFTNQFKGVYEFKHCLKLAALFLLKMTASSELDFNIILR